MLKNIDLIPAFKRASQQRMISPIMPATRDYNLSVDLTKFVGPSNTNRIKQVNIITDDTLDGMSLYSPTPRFKMNERENTNYSESQ